ncbi:hypothetical protein FOZ62_016927, partial [Perkinsus olseni]
MGPRNQQSRREGTAVKLSSRSSEGGKSRSPNRKRSREDNDDDHAATTRPQPAAGPDGDSGTGVTLTPAALTSSEARLSSGSSGSRQGDRKRRHASSSPEGAGIRSNDEYNDSDHRRRIRPRRDGSQESHDDSRKHNNRGNDQGGGEGRDVDRRSGESWYKEGSDDERRDRGEDKPRRSGGIHASYEAHIDHRGSHDDGERNDAESQRGRSRREEGPRHSSREDSRWYGERDGRGSSTRPRSRDCREDAPSGTHGRRYHRSRGRDDNDDDGEEWYSSSKSRWRESGGRSSWSTRGRGGKGAASRSSHHSDTRDFEPRGKIEGSSTVWVGSLPNAITDDEFYDVMSRYGEVRGMKLVALKGFAYVKYGDEESAEAAVKALNGEVLDIAGDKPEHELKTKVDYVEDMGYLNHPYKPSMDKKPDVVHTLFVGNLPVEVTEQDIREFFERDPSIRIEQIALRRGSYKQMCYAHIRFEGDDDAEKAVS